MTDRLNKTSICSIVFLDIIDYSQKSVSEQIDDKSLFNALVSEAIKNVAQNDRIILDTGDGAAITLMGAPEEALFVALTIRDGIVEHNNKGHQPLFVRIGINLGSVRVVKDINDRPNIIGDGINVAQRIMSFAGENQILVSRSYYEVTSRLTKEITGMFAYSGVKQDKHVREHEVYLIKPKDNVEAEASKIGASAVKVVSDVVSEPAVNKLAVPPFLTIKSDYVIYMVAAFVFVALLLWYFLSLKPAPQSASELDELKESSPISYPVELKKQNTPQPVTGESTDIKSAKEATKKPVEKKAVTKKGQVKDTQVKRERQSQQSEQRSAESRISNSESTRKAEAPKCSQAQIAMNQCR